MLLCTLLLSKNALSSTENVYRSVSNHINTIACGTHLERKDIFLLSTQPTQEYLILWFGDKGCNGGSSSESYHISKVTQSYYDKSKYIVSKQNAFGQQVSDEINFRFIESMRRLNASTFQIISWDYADGYYGGNDQGNNFPSNKFEYIVRKYGDDDTWHVDSKNFIHSR